MSAKRFIHIHTQKEKLILVIDLRVNLRNLQQQELKIRWRGLISLLDINTGSVLKNKPLDDCSRGSKSIRLCAPVCVAARSHFCPRRASDELFHAPTQRWMGQPESSRLQNTGAFCSLPLLWSSQESVSFLPSPQDHLRTILMHPWETGRREVLGASPDTEAWSACCDYSTCTLRNNK